MVLSECEIHEGLTTESFKLAGLEKVSARCFSLVAPSRTLDLYCPGTGPELRLWVSTLRALLMSYHMEGAYRVDAE